MKLQTNLKRTRLKKGYKQAEIAELLGISVRQYQRVEAGTAFLAQEKLNKLEDTFQIPQRVLLAKNVEEIPNFYNDYVTALNTDN